MELADVTDSKSVGGNTVWVRLPPSAPRRSKLYIACSDFCFQKSERGNMPLLLLFRKKARSARLFACKRAHNGSQSLPPFCEMRLRRCLAHYQPFVRAPAVQISRRVRQCLSIFTYCFFTIHSPLKLCRFLESNK